MLATFIPSFVPFSHLMQGNTNCFLLLSGLSLQNYESLLLLLLLFIHLIVILFLLMKWRSFRQKLLQRNKELELANKRLLESEKKLKHESAVKSKMYSILAHDLRNPSNAIIGFSQLLAGNPGKYSSQEIQKFTSIINKSARNVYSMLDNLLEWSKSQTDRLQVKPESFDLHALILNLFTLYELSSYTRNIDIVCKVDKGTLLHTDRNILFTILRNLLDNALKFTPEGGTISFSGNLKNKIVEISISDTGAGMSQEKIQTLFNLENLANTVSAGSTAGHGLGLILCRDFAEMLGGSIRVESAPGKGSTFLIQIPSNDLHNNAF